MKRLAHLMKITNFAKGISNFYNENYPDHTIVYVNGESKNFFQNKQIIKTKSIFTKRNKLQRLFQFLKILKDYDYVVLHSLAILDSFGLLVYMLPKHFYKKMIWIEWGGDLYRSNENAIISIIKKRVKRLFKIVVFIFPPDLDYYKKVYKKSKSLLFYAPYTSNLIDSFYLRNLISATRIKSATNNKVRIMVGHNGKKDLNHIRVLKNLLKFKDRNFELFIPLSYGGDKDYLDRVKAFALNNFKNVIFLNDMLPREKYNELIRKVDIAIFDTNRQIGLANINMLLFQNTKIYMNTACSMFQYFKSEGFDIQDSQSIPNISFEEFIKPLSRIRNIKTIEYFKFYTDVGKKKQLWDNVYSAL